jgi:CheY-like chemotaxis protein
VKGEGKLDHKPRLSFTLHPSPFTLLFRSGSLIAFPKRVTSVPGNSPGRILVVDDEPAIRALLKKIIERRGFTVDGARDGAEAIDLLQKHRYNLILVDLMMPNVNGFELVDYLSQHADKPRPAVIIITAAAEGTPLRELDATIVHSVIRKPFDIDVVADLVEAAAGSVSMANEAQDEDLDEGDNVIPFHAC